MRIAARCCFTVGTEPGWVRMLGGHVERRDIAQAEAPRLAPPQELHAPATRARRAAARRSADVARANPSATCGWATRAVGGSLGGHRPP